MENLTKIIKGSEVSTNIKVKLMQTIIFPAVLNRCESWTLKKGDKRKIRRFQPTDVEMIVLNAWARSNASVINQRNLCILEKR